MRTLFTSENMKKFAALIFTVVLILLTSCGNTNSSSADTKNSTGKSEIAFSEYQHDFGKVAEGEKLNYTFDFKNKGTADLIITSASTTCGCTVPRYDTKPIAVGNSGKLKVVFDTSGRNGLQTKVITVKSNASTPVVLLKITAEVVTNDK
jgi:hypothetical protein